MFLFCPSFSTPNKTQCLRSRPFRSSSKRWGDTLLTFVYQKEAISISGTNGSTPVSPEDRKRLSFQNILICSKYQMTDKSWNPVVRHVTCHHQGSSKGGRGLYDLWLWQRSPQPHKSQFPSRGPLQTGLFGQPFSNFCVLGSILLDEPADSQLAVAQNCTLHTLPYLLPTSHEHR
jgi:hypothetical protein